MRLFQQTVCSFIIRLQRTLTCIKDSKTQLQYLGSQNTAVPGKRVSSHSCLATHEVE